MKKVELLAKIDAAKHVITEAEKELARVLAALDQMPRAEKQQISDTIQKAFAHLHETRNELVALLGAVKDDEGPIE